MLQLMCSTVVCLTQYLGLGTLLYQSQNELILTTKTQTYYCIKYTSLYNCSPFKAYSNKDY